MSALAKSPVPTKVAAGIRTRIGNAIGDRRGMAAVEFALILPVLLLFYIGASDVTRGIMANRDVDLLSRTISDLVAQQTTGSDMPSSTITTIFTTGSAIMSPFPIDTLTMTVSAVDIKADGSNKCCQALVRWSYTQGGTLRGGASCGQTTLDQVDASITPSPTNIPKGIVSANKDAGYGYTSGKVSYVIVADVTYTYVPFFSQVASWFTPPIRKTTFMVPRSISNPITLASPVSAASGQSGQICF